MKKPLTLLLLLFISFSAYARVHPPKGVTMGPNPYPEPSFNPGGFKVILTEIPESKMSVVQYIWVEDFQKGLKYTAEKLEKMPVVAFDGVFEEDAKRIVKNLIFLKCKASYEKKEEIQDGEAKSP